MTNYNATDIALELLNEEQNKRDVDIVREYLDTPELLTSLAEEAGELNHAALKLRRALTKKNPTPVTVDEAMDMVLTELADVWNSLDALGIIGATELSIIKAKKPGKMARWIDRLIEEAGK